jgi:hypothetical protein
MFRRAVEAQSCIQEITCQPPLPTPPLIKALMMPAITMMITGLVAGLVFLRQPTIKISDRCIYGFTLCFVGGSMAFAYSPELFQPGLQFVQPQNL